MSSLVTTTSSPENVVRSARVALVSQVRRQLLAGMLGRNVLGPACTTEPTEQVGTSLRATEPARGPGTAVSLVGDSLRRRQGGGAPPARARPALHLSARDASLRPHGQTAMSASGTTNSTATHPASLAGERRAPRATPRQKRRSNG